MFDPDEERPPRLPIEYSDLGEIYGRYGIDPRDPDAPAKWRAAVRRAAELRKQGVDPARPDREGEPRAARRDADRTREEARPERPGAAPSVAVVKGLKAPPSPGAAPSLRSQGTNRSRVSTEAVVWGVAALGRRRADERAPKLERSRLPGS
ncbi:hypothetical protein GCM10023205_78540 [Yinghuangia aomiensis]|uniref:Uncharacterized protein n=1 Tax=Yinghuangia aomiensis TaxID=676205 RepID=A0ABP9IBV3_9ACTN